MDNLTLGRTRFARRQLIEDARFIERLSRMGVDGMLILWVDCVGECRQWIDQVLPVMEQAGQRCPFTPVG